MKRKIGRIINIHNSIIYVFLFCFSTLLIFITVVYQKKHDVNKARYLVNHTYKVIQTVDEINAKVAEAEAAVRAYLVSSDSGWRKTLFQNQAELQTKIIIAQSLTADNPVQKKNFKELSQLVMKKINFQNKLKPTASDIQISVDYNSDGPRLGQDIRYTLTLISKEENRLLLERIKDNNSISNENMNTTLWGIGLSFLLMLGMLYKLNKDIQVRKIITASLETSERKYRYLIENAGAVIYSTDINGKITFASSKATELTGYNVEELLGMDFSVLIDPEWVDIVRKKYINQLALLQKESWLDFPIITKDGETKWVEQSAILLFDNQEITGFQCIVKDISERKAMEKILQAYEVELVKNQERLQSILDNTTSLIYIKDLDGKYIVTNKCFKESLSANEEVIGKTDFDFMDYESAVKYKIGDAKVVQTAKPLKMEDIIHMEDGEHHFLIIKFPLIDTANKVYGISGIATDVTEMVRQQEQLVKAKKIAEDARKMQEQFLANMSHEIRTPMNGIHGMINLLLETHLNAEQKEFAQTIKRSSDNLMVLINDILDFSKIKAGKLTIEEIDFNLHDILYNIKETFRYRINEKQIDFKINVADDLPNAFNGDPYRLNQILINLIGNAIKFTNKGLVEINITAKEKTEQVVTLNFDIKDTGIGIEEDQIDEIFGSFTQANANITRKYGGTGLGLAITKQLLELQHGNISVKSIPGNGSVFSFSIPYKYAKSVKQEEIVPSSNLSYKNALAGRYFLIVEDNVVNQKVISHVIQKAGGFADVANHGLEAIEYLKNKKDYDVIILDLQMPEMDGYETTKVIRNDMKLNIPIIAMTASAIKGEKSKCIEFGMNDYLSKPFAFQDFYKAVNSLVNHSSVTDNVTEDLSPAGSQPLYDLSLLNEMDDTAYIAEIITIFITETPPELEAMLEAANNANYQVVATKAHKLKSSVGLLQAAGLYDLLTQLEENAKSIKSDKEIVYLLSKITDDYKKVELLLKQHLEKMQNPVTST